MSAAEGSSGIRTVGETLGVFSVTWLRSGVCGEGWDMVQVHVVVYVETSRWAHIYYGEDKGPLKDDVTYSVTAR